MSNLSPSLLPMVSIAGSPAGVICMATTGRSDLPPPPWQEGYRAGFLGLALGTTSDQDYREGWMIGSAERAEQ
jgi:hypothetical protein